jgi:histidinol dehydrogenase
MLTIISSHDRKRLARLLERRHASLESAERAARRIVREVRRHGDRALVRLTRRLDGVDLRKAGFTVGREEIARAHREVPPGFLPALRIAARNIRAVARRQLPRAWQSEIVEGVRVGEIIRPLRCVACYVPGGRNPFPSTVLMSVIPAQVAGVEEIVITTPRPAAAVLVAAEFLGIKKIYRLGGAQAVAAFAYGTESVPRADKIVGPGNRFVAAAKKLVAGDCGIDFIAGPTELVMVGGRGKATWIAADLMAQAEHDPDAVALFFTPSRALAVRVRQAAVALVARLGIKVAEDSLRRSGAIVVTGSLTEAIDLANSFAPEHLSLLDDAADEIGRVRSAGSIFLGGTSPVAAGDYASGSNHILPTSGVARLRGGLSARDFVKVISLQRLSRPGLRRLRRAVVELARTEGLAAHAHSIETRFTDDGPAA